MWIILIALAVGAVLLYIAFQATQQPINPRPEWVGARGDLSAQDIISIGSGKAGPYIPPPPEPFRHTINSAVACGYLMAFLQLADQAKITQFESVLTAIGKPNLQHWSYANASLGLSDYSRSVIIPGLTKGNLSVNDLTASVPDVIIKLVDLLGKLDADIKRKIAEAEACLSFVHWFSEVYSLPPMALLNMLSNLVPDSVNYSLIKGWSGAMDRSKEPGVGIVADMIKLFGALKEKGVLQGIKPILNVRAYRDLVNKGEIKTAINNRIGKLKVTGRGLAYWPRYCWSVDNLFLRAKHWRSGYSEKLYKQALKRCYERTGNFWEFDRQAAKEWLESGGIYQGDFKGYLQPTLVIFELGHDPGLGGYGGFDTGFLGGVASQAKPSFGESTWLTRFDVDTNGGWLYVR